jgi:two-component system, NarL family, sensor histidine kinase UhpB
MQLRVHSGFISTKGGEGSSMGNETALKEVIAVGGVITDHHPLDFYGLGLAGCIDRLTGPLRQQGTAVRWDTPHWGIEIPAQCASLLYQSAREALSNAYKYSEASELTVQLAAVGHGVRLVVSDDGTGFDSHLAFSGRHHGYGLRLMSVAVHEAGGTVQVCTTPGQGTTVTVTLPLD